MEFKIVLNQGPRVIVKGTLLLHFVHFFSMFYCVAKRRGALTVSLSAAEVPLKPIPFEGISVDNVDPFLKSIHKAIQKAILDATRKSKYQSCIGNFLCVGSILFKRRFDHHGFRGMEFLGTLLWSTCRRARQLASSLCLLYGLHRSRPFW